VREHLASLDVDPAVDDGVDGVAGGRDRLSDVKQVVSKLPEPLADPFRRPVLDVILEFVDLLVQRIDEVEKPLGDLVHQVVGDHAGLLDAATLTGLVHAARVERLAAGGRLADCQDEVLRQHDVDLLVVDTILFRNRDRD